MKRFLLVVAATLGLAFIWSAVSYAAMLERQEGSFWQFMQAVVQTSFGSSREAVIADQSGRFLIRGNQADFLNIAQRKNWIFIDQMGGAMRFRAEGREFTVNYRQYTGYFIVCKEL